MTSYNLGKVSIHIITIIKLTTLQGKEHFELVEFVPNSRHKIIDPLWLQIKLKKTNNNQAFHSKTFSF